MPRSLLKNGKRSSIYLDVSRQSELTSSQTNSTGSAYPPQLSQAPPAAQPNDSSHLSLLMKDINLLRNDINDLKREVSHLHRQNQSSTAIDSCHIKVYFPGLNKLVLEPVAVSNLLGCPSMQVTRISSKTIKVKIQNPASTKPCSLQTPHPISCTCGKTASLGHQLLMICRFPLNGRATPSKSPPGTVEVYTLVFLTSGT